MASINSVTIDLKFTGLNNLEQATKKMRQVQTEVKRLAKEERAGSISSQQYAKRVDQLSKELSKIAKGNRNAANSVVLYSKQVRAGIKAEEDSKKAAEANKIAQQQLEQVRKKNAFIVAMQEQRLKEEARAARETAAADAAMAREKERLAIKYNPLRAATFEYERQVRELNRAQELGIITDRKRQKSLDVLGAEYREFMSGAASANNRFAQHTNQASRGLNQMGVLAQQTGYQVGDFLVQVQSGTNVMVALGQQATQLVGTFAMLAKTTRSIAIFSGLGILVPLVTAGAGAWMRYKEAQEDAAKSTENLKNELESLDDTLENWIRAKTAAAAGLTVEQVLGLGGLEEARRNLQNARNELAKTVETGPSIMIGEERLAIKGLDQLKAEKAEREAIAEVELARLRVTRIQQRLDEQRVLTVAEIRQELQQEAQMALTIAKFGEESAEVAKLEAEQEKIKFAQRVAQLDISEKQKMLLITQYEETKKMVEEAKNTEVATRSVLDVLEQIIGVDISKEFMEAARAVTTMNTRLDITLSKIGGILRAIGSIGFETVAIEAETRALRAGRTEAQASIEGRLAQQRAELETAGAPEVAIRAAEIGMRSALESRMQAETERQAALSDPRRTTRPSQRPMDLGVTDTGGTSGAGTGAAGPNIAEEFERLKRSIDDAYEASQKFKESKDVLDRAMASGVIKTTEEYNRLLGLLREEYDLTSEKGDTFADNMMKIAQTARDALGDAFMSIVDGTKSAKDAFADMARIILKQAFELLVIKPILDGIFGGLTGGGGGGFLSFLVNANGNAFSGGNVIPFANGGVVGGPMAFPMSGGRMGLMGEAGPEAIMPLKRGKGGKLGVVAEGGGGNVTVQNHFHIAANGDESVKRIIAQEAPKIANLTQKQVLEARSRGGAFRTTFGA